MTRRIIKKHIDIGIARALSLPVAIAHAKPSFWRMDVKAQRAALRWALVRQLGVAPQCAARAVQGMTFSPSMAIHL